MAKKRRKSTSDSVIEGQLDSRIADLEAQLSGDALMFSGPISYGIDDQIRDCVEARFGDRATRKPKMVMILETNGGYIEITERIVTTLRQHYREVEFIVPNYAMSAGTVLALSGDAIHMDYYSILGPIDPQVESGANGRMVPALGYLEIFNRLVEKSKNNSLTTAELSFLVQRFDPAELYQYEQAREQSINLLEEWLAKYKFKNWKVTRTKKTKVTPAIRRQRAKEIAELLNRTEEWHSHGRGISMEILKKKVKLEIDDFGKKPSLNNAIRGYYDLMTHYMMRLVCTGVIHVKGKFVPLSRS